MIKLLAIDLDGTMYTSDRKITARVREAIARAQELGLQIAIVTGRGRRGAELALDTLKMDLPFICSAGALICSGKNGSTIHSWTFHKHDELMHVINFSRKHKTGLLAEHLGEQAYWFEPDRLNDVIDPHTHKETERSIRSFEPEKDFDLPLLKVTIAADPHLLAKAEQVVREECPSIHQVYSGIQYIDLTADGVNKGSALIALAEYLNLQPNEIAAIGDQGIDIHMLMAVGLPIAMSNAVPELKQVAKYIAPSNDEDGVAWAVDKILKNN